MDIRVYQSPIGDWQAIDSDRYDGALDAGRQLVGWGKTEQEAIHDLKEQIAEADNESAQVEQMEVAP